MKFSFENQNGEKIEIIDNVKSYFIGKQKTDIETFDSQPDESRKYFLCIENVECGAFGHWILESFVFLLKYLREIKDKYDLMVHLKEPKKFKYLFLNKIGITDDLIFTEELSENNTCIFPPGVTVHNQINYFKITNLLPSLKSLYTIPHEKEIDVLVMPRQKKENYVYNDRVYIGLEDIHLELSKKYKSVILNTDEITNLDDQLKLLKMSKVIIATFGSPFIINGIFCENSTIICCGHDGDFRAFNSFFHTLEFIRYHNVVYFLRETSTFMNYLNSHIIPMVNERLRIP